MTSITLDNIKKAYGETVIMEDMDFKVNSGEKLVLLGPSGCGKSTILRMIAGFEDITDGNLYFGEERMNEVLPKERGVSMVFQNYALYPHMTVEENITYGLKINNVPKERIKERVDEVVEFLNLTQYMDRKPSELSGGQQQRVALARATVKDTDIFLLDEPLSNLDAQLRVSARESLMDIHRRYGQTIIYVTHDQIEAMTFGDRIALLNFGELQQLDSPENVYRKPANIFTAEFIGNPPMNVFDSSNYSDGLIHIGSQNIHVFSNWREYLQGVTQKDLRVGIRPENIRLYKNDIGNTFKGKIEYIENLGSDYALTVNIDGQRFTAIEKFKTFSVGEEVYIEFINDHLSFFDANTTNNVGYPESIDRKIEVATGHVDEDLTALIAADDEAQAAEKEKFFNEIHQ